MEKLALLRINGKISVIKNILKDSLAVTNNTLVIFELLSAVYKCWHNNLS